MQKQAIKKNSLFIFLVTALLAVVALFAVFAFRGSAYSTVAAEGNAAVSPDGTPEVESFVLDVNGKYASMISNAIDSTRDAMISNNSLNLGERIVTTAALIEMYNNAHGTSLDTTEYYFVDAGPTGGYKSVYVDSSKFDVVVNSATTQLTVTAKAATGEDYEHFSVQLGKRRSSGTGAYYDPFITVYFNVRVYNTFLQFSGMGTGDMILVGNDLTSATSAETDATKTPVHAAVLTLDNNDKATIKLSEVLQNHILYVKSSDEDMNYIKPITMDDAEGSKLWWGVRSVENFVITDVMFENAFDKKIMSEAGANGIDPTITGDLSITTSILNQYCEANKGDVAWFWASTTVHRLTLTVMVKGDSSRSYILAIPVRFRPANPQRKNLDKSKFSLNALSPYTYDMTSSEVRDAAGNVITGTDTASGYSSIIIRPSDLIEYSAPASYATNYGDYNILSFDASTTSGFGVDVLNPSIESERYESEFYVIEKVIDINPDTGEPRKDKSTAYPDAVKITAKDNSYINISLGVSYFTSNGRCPSANDVVVSIPINCYGNYAITIPDVNNKKGITYNVLTSDIFGELLDAGFQMSSAESLNTDQLSVQFSDNMLTLTPLVDQIDGQTTARVRMEFTNSSSQRITIESNLFAINVKAQDFFSLFDADWKAWLVIAAIILGGIIIILLIVWLFIHSISKHRQDEAAMQAPVSSYIVKLNSTIAATQAQQRLAATQALTQASNQMLLGAGPASTPAAMPNTLQLASGTDEQNSSIPSDGVFSEPRMSEPRETTNSNDAGENLYDKIAEYISDEELLERIFTEKYEPKGMVRRTFFKSKDLQSRELEKEKKRIIERYKTPMPMVEAIMSESEIKNSESKSEPKETTAETEVVTNTEIYILNFDPESPLYTPVPEVKDEFSEEKIEIDVAPEEQHLRELEKQYEILIAELEELKNRLDNAQSESDKVTSHADELREKIAKAEADKEGFAKDIEDLEFKLASAKQKDKDKITRDIKINEEKIEHTTNDIEKWKAELELYVNGGDTLSDILSKLNALQEQKTGDKENVTVELEKARAEYDAYMARLEQVRLKQELEAKVENLKPMLVAVNTADYEIKKLQKVFDSMNKERDDIKSDVAAAKAQILGANDFDVINELNQRISDGNARLSDIEKDFTKATKQNSELNIEFNSQRRKANEFVEENDIPLEEVIRAEDKVIGDIEFEAFKLVSEKDRDEAEQNVAAAQAAFDDVSASSGDVTLIAMEIAAGIKDLEDELASTQAELDEINAKMEAADDDERLMLMVDQGDKADKVEELKEKVKQANVDGTKRKTEVQAEYDEKLEVARHQLDEASEEFRKSSEKYDSLINNTDPLDLIVSGSGVISQDQKKREEENLKKQLERSKNEIEQARLAAQQAQEEAEQARINADLAAAAAKEEAERKAQEAIEQAEAARLEAEEKARLEAEAAEQARKEAEEAAEQARREAEEATEQARKEAEDAVEQARKEAEDAAEQARKEAEDAADQARKEAEDAADQARKEAEDAAEQARREAEEEAERLRRESQEAIIAEAEEAKRRAQEEIDEMRRKTEEEAEQKRIEEENRLKEEEARKKEEEERKKAEDEHREAIAKKVAARKEQIIFYRNKMKDLKGEEDAKLLREELYTQQLSYDEDERGSTELMDFYNKTMDDIQHAGEIAKLKAENAKKPQRVVRKVTERVNRIAKRKPKKKSASGARRPAARPGAAGARSRSASARPRSAGARPAGARPAGARPRPSGTRPSGTRPPTRRS